MKKYNLKLKTLVGIACTTVATLGMAIPLIYWIFNPELTAMQSILKFWYMIPLVIGCYFGIFWSEEIDF